MPKRTHRTKTGRILTDADMEALADEAEKGYDIPKHPGGRPLVLGKARAVVVPIRMPPELKEEVERLAEAEETSVSEIVRDALRERLSRK